MIEADLTQQFSWVIPVCLFPPFDGQAGSHHAMTAEDVHSGLIPINVRALSGLPRKKKCGGARSCGRGSFDRVV
jgi:hypothetical protein